MTAPPPAEPARKSLTITLDIAAQPRTFALKFAGLVALEKAAAGADGEPVGPMIIYRSLLQAHAPAGLIRTTLIEGLKGAGEESPGPIVDAYLAEYPLGDALVVAEKVLGAALFGAEPAD